eukprot:m.177136 g.177136  ORF g.177136 m.177136 type:complete len:387 (-) comp53366_c0_seq3:30-1190(-)
MQARTLAKTDKCYWTNARNRGPQDSSSSPDTTVASTSACALAIDAGAGSSETDGVASFAGSEGGSEAAEAVASAPASVVAPGSSTTAFAVSTTVFAVSTSAFGVTSPAAGVASSTTRAESTTASATAGCSETAGTDSMTTVVVAGGSSTTVVVVAGGSSTTVVVAGAWEEVEGVSEAGAARTSSVTGVVSVRTVSATGAASTAGAVSAGVESANLTTDSLGARSTEGESAVGSETDRAVDCPFAGLATSLRTVRKESARKRCTKFGSSTRSSVQVSDRAAASATSLGYCLPSFSFMFRILRKMECRSFLASTSMFVYWWNMLAEWKCRVSAAVLVRSSCALMFSSVKLIWVWTWRMVATSSWLTVACNSPASDCAASICIQSNAWW